MAQRTPLYDEHLKLNAKMVEFAGWDMPLYYGSQIEEHNQVRQDAGMFDVSHMVVIDVIGHRAKEYLLYLLANNVDKLKDIGKALYSCMLNERGGVIDDLIVYKISPTDFRIVSNAATHDKDLAWLKQQAVPFGVALKEHTAVAMIAVQGPNAREKIRGAFSAAQNQAAESLVKPFYGVASEGLWIARTGYTGEDGYEIILPAEKAVSFWQALLQCGIKPCGLVARDSLRLEAGMSLYGSEMDENVTPLEANLAWTVAFAPKERNFIGRTVLDKQQADGVTKQLVGLVLEERGVLRSHQKVLIEGVGEGETTSGGFAPTLNTSVALARVPIAAKMGNSCKVIIRDRPVAARIVKPPFVRHGKKVF